MKLVVLSDLHLCPPGDLVSGLDPHVHLSAAIARINATHGDADLVVVAGDITDRGRTAAYAALKDQLGDLQVPWAVTLGNHDNRDVFAKVFGAAHLNADGFVQSAHWVGDQVVLLLDTLKKGPTDGAWGCGEGMLCEARLAWLAQELDRAEGRPVTLVMHHPVLQVSPIWDAYLLEQPERLLETLDGYPDLRGVIAGHIHMATMTLRRGVPFTTIAGGFLTNREEFGGRPARVTLTGPAQMAVVLGGPETSVLHFDDYVNAHPELAAG